MRPRKGVTIDRGMAKSEKSMVPFLSLICKEFEPPAPYDTTVEFMPTMQFIGLPTTLFNLVLRLPPPILKNRLIKGLRVTFNTLYIYKYRSK